MTDSAVSCNIRPPPSTGVPVLPHGGGLSTTGRVRRAAQVDVLRFAPRLVTSIIPKKGKLGLFTPRLGVNRPCLGVNRPSYAVKRWLVLAMPVWGGGFSAPLSVKAPF